MGEAPSSRYDYKILLDYDPFGTTSRNLMEFFHNILLLTNRSFQNLLEDSVNTSYGCYELL